MISRRAICGARRVSIISDHPLAAHALKKLLGDTPNWTVNTYNSPSYAANSRDAIQNENGEIAVIDKGTVTSCFPANVRQIKRARPSARLIVIDQPLPADEECLLLSLGVHGFLPYAEVHRDLGRAIRCVCNGKLWFKPERLHNYVEYLSRWKADGRDHRTVGSQLTQREQEIAALIRRGLFTAQIGKELSISSSTVKFHVGHILAKLGLRHRREILSLKPQDQERVIPFPLGNILQASLAVRPEQQITQKNRPLAS